MMGGNINCQPHSFNPSAGNFTPSSTMASHYAPDLKARMSKLEHGQASLRSDVEELRALYNGLATLDAGRLRKELDQLSHDVREAQPESKQQTNGNGFKNEIPLAPHLRAKQEQASMAAASFHQNDNHGSPFKPLERPILHPSVIDEPIDIPMDGRQVQVPEPVPSPPGSDLAPTPTNDRDTLTTSIADLSLNDTNTQWLPHFLKRLPSLSNETIKSIPEHAQSFSADFLLNTFGGITWSPGMKYIPPHTGTSILKNRTYYMLDAKNEPYLPQHPGDHGAKLTAFFNKNPEDEFGDLKGSSYEDVPMFIALPGGKRYGYFGHYSQTRWSDKLDYDHMVSVVPDHVKHYWADELVAVGRPNWLTQQLMKHFFPQPEYGGRLFGSHDGTATTVEEPKVEERMIKDVKQHIEELKEWDKDAKMKTSMMKKDFILQAFERADADNPPALRLWWEYLECIDWKKDFYDLLVQLQSRDASYAK